MSAPLRDTAPTAERLLFVEGVSDRVAVETIARRQGRDLEAEGAAVQDLGGASKIRHQLRYHLQDRRGLGIAGLYDVGEMGFFAGALTDAGLGTVEDAGRLEQLGFFACVRDLEDELLRAVGERAALEIVEAAGESAAFHRLSQQPTLRDLSLHHQLHRFVGSRDKFRYATLLAEAVPLDAVPDPIQQALWRI